MIWEIIKIFIKNKAKAKKNQNNQNNQINVYQNHHQKDQNNQNNQNKIKIKSNMHSNLQNWLLQGGSPPARRLSNFVGCCAYLILFWFYFDYFDYFDLFDDGFDIPWFDYFDDFDFFGVGLWFIFDEYFDYFPNHQFTEEGLGCMSQGQHNRSASLETARKSLRIPKLIRSIQFW